MDVREGLFSFGMMGISVLAAYFLFRKKPRESLVSRGPVYRQFSSLLFRWIRGATAGIARDF
jgi:hypothetical protein